MKRKPILRTLALLLCICMLATSMVGVIPALAAEDSTIVYFLNSEKWAEVGVYVYGDQGELMGGWPGQNAVAADELGGDWMKIEVPGVTPFNIIFFNTASDAQRAELLIDSADKVYVTTAVAAYASQAEAETAMGVVSGNWLYFLNVDQWPEVGAYIYGDKGELLGGWGTTTAVAATELGGDWMKVEVSDVPPYSAIFFNTADDSQRTELYLDAADKIYVAAGSAFSTKEAAEVAAGVVEATVSTVYFYNADGWTEVYGYVYANGSDADLSWPGRAAEQVDGSWWKVEIPVNAETTNYNIIFHNNAGNQVGDPLITRNDNNYVAVTDFAVVYASQPSASILH